MNSQTVNRIAGELVKAVREVELLDDLVAAYGKMDNITDFETFSDAQLAISTAQTALADFRSQR